MGKEDVAYIHIYNEILLGHNKEWNNAIYNNMDANEDYQYKMK